MGKEMDEARTIAGVSCVGLYYYGARYLDPKYSRRISTDPALGEYIPKAPIDEDAKKYNRNLPGMGGAIGSGIDQKNGFDAQTEGKKWPAQVTGERINGAVSLGLTTAGYVNSVVESSSLHLPPSKDQIINEVSHQYDVYNNTKLMTEEK